MTNVSLKKYRPNLYFLSGLLAAAAIAFWSENATSGATLVYPHIGNMPESLARIPLAKQRALTTAEEKAAEKAWQYFIHNTNPNTGLANSVDGFQSTTMWEVGGYIFALIAAERLQIIDPSEFEYRAKNAIVSLEKIPLFDDRLPNKAYHTETLAMVTYQNETTETGLGWSALDMARFLLSLQALRELYPEFREEISSLLRQWDLEALTQSGRLAGADRLTADTSIRIVQEGRIGYEQYAARSLLRLGMTATKSGSAQSILKWIEMEGIEVPADRRTVEGYGAINPTLSEPYLLMGLELGWDEESHYLASQIYKAMEQRYNQSGVLTVLSEDHLDQAPHFLYGSVISNGQPWEVTDESGATFNELRTISLKASFAWDALLETQYSTYATSTLKRVAGRKNGWIAGLYEQDLNPNEILTLNTNAVVLEALHYKKFGPLLSPYN